MFLQFAVRVCPPLRPLLEQLAPKSPPPWLHSNSPLLLAIFALRSIEVGLELPLTVAQLAERVVPLNSSEAQDAAKSHCKKFGHTFDQSSLRENRIHI